MPLLVSAVTQNSAWIWKSLYELWETRYASLLSLSSATMAPSRALQLPPPMVTQLFRPSGPSISVSHRPVVGGGAPAQPMTARAASSDAAAKERNRVTS